MHPAKHVQVCNRSSAQEDLGEIDNTPAAVERLVHKLERTYKTLHVCYQAGPTGYGLYQKP